MMVSELLGQIAEMVLAGAGVASIEEAIIDPAPVDEEQKSVLWLYAQALQERRSDGMLARAGAKRELILPEPIRRGEYLPLKTLDAALAVGA